MIGAAGQLGSSLVKVLGDRAIPLYHREVPAGMVGVDVCNSSSLRVVFQSVQPDWIINCAATHKVDELESQPAHALSVNAIGAWNVAQAAKNIGAGVVYISSDYVFGHNGPWIESDLRRPLSVYGVSKVAGEGFTMAYAPKWLIVRTSTLFGGSKSFVKTVLRLSEKNDTLTVTDDRTMSPSYAPDVARKIISILEMEEKTTAVQGFYSACHITNTGSCTFKQFAEEIFEQAGLSIEVLPGKAADRDIAMRPRNSTLKQGFLSYYGLDDMRSWQEALSEYLQEIL